MHAVRNAISNCSPAIAAHLHAELTALQLLSSHFPSLQHQSVQHFCSFADNAIQQQQKKKVVFLGTPTFSALVLHDLIEASHKLVSQPFEVAAVVSRRPGGKGAGHGGRHAGAESSGGCDSSSNSCNEEDAVDSSRRRASKAQFSPVEAKAREMGVKPSSILCPGSAREEEFLQALEALQPDLCITAAYGCILPERFLALPPLGTINIHPSLLPKYRGAAPVQRALCDGVSETGVSLAYTVFKCDAGPVLAQEKVQVDPNEQAPDLTDRLFRLGSKLLLQHLPSILSGKAMQAALPQPHDQATHAAKVTREDSYLDLSQPANSIHNVVRALAGWPGARAALLLEEHRKGTCVLQPMEIKVMRTRVLDRLPPPSHPPHVPRKQQSRAHPAACQSHGSSEHLSSKRSSEEHSSSSSSSSSSSNISSGSSSSSSSACRDSERWPHPPSPASDRDLFSMAPLGGREQQLPDSLPTLCSPGAASADSSKLVVRTNTQALETPCPPPRDGNSLQPQASQPPEVPPCVSPRPTADLGGTADAAGNGHSARLADGGNSDRPASSALAGGAAEAAGSRHSARLADGGNSDRPASSALAGGAAEAAGSGRSARLADGGNSDRLASSALAGGAAEAADGGNSDRLAVGGNSDRPASSALAGGAAEAADSGDSARLADGGNSDRLASSALAGGAAEAADGGNSDRLADGDNSDRQASSALPAGVVGLVEGCMIIPCGHGTLLEVVEVRHSAGQFGRGRGSSLSGREFMNGLARRRLLLPPRGTVPTSH